MPDTIMTFTKEFHLDDEDVKRLRGIRDILRDSFPGTRDITDYDAFVFIAMSHNHSVKAMISDAEYHLGVRVD